MQGHELIERYLASFRTSNRVIAGLEAQLKTTTGTRLMDWTDHFSFRFSREREDELLEHGFLKIGASKELALYTNQQLPQVIVLRSSGNSTAELALRVDLVANYLMVRGQSAAIEGSAYSSYRRSCVGVENNTALWIVERRELGHYRFGAVQQEDLSRYLQAYEGWRCRPRDWDDAEEAVKQAVIRAERLSKELRKGRAAALVLECERDYWHSRNRVAQLQKARQDHMGLGWGNHRCHVFYSSRSLFQYVLQLFQGLGFAVAETLPIRNGFGGCLLKHPETPGDVLIAVDLEEGELLDRPLPPAKKLGPVGLWCGLHGESVLQGGMHHLEIRAVGSEVLRYLSASGMEVRPSTFTYDEKRRFTAEPELWPVSARRLKHLTEQGLLPLEEAARIAKQGATGSHLEIVS